MTARSTSSQAQSHSHRADLGSAPTTHAAPFSVDALDARVLRGLLSQGGVAWRSHPMPINDLSQHVGAHRNTIRARIRRFESHNVLLPLAWDPIPEAVGLRRWRAEWRGTPPTTASLEAAFLVEGLRVAHLHQEGWSGILVAQDETTATANAQILARLMSCKLRRIDPSKTRATGKLTRRRRALLGALSGRPVSYTNVPSEWTGSSRTLRREIDHLIETQALQILPMGTAPPGMLREQRDEADPSSGASLSRFAGDQVAWRLILTQTDENSTSESHAIERHVSPRYHEWLRRRITWDIDRS